MTAAPVELLATGGPWFDDLAVGDSWRSGGLTMTPGHVAVHRAIVGEPFALAADEALARRVIGSRGLLVSPALVWDVAIGQSSAATQRGLANLFYRGLTNFRPVFVGDTLRTTTTVAALKRNRSRPSGLVLLRIETADEQGRDVLRVWRCGMLPAREAQAAARSDADDVVGASGCFERAAASEHVAGWDLEAFTRCVEGRRPHDLAVGHTWPVAGGDVVSSAPELARLTGNVASAHHDAGAGASGRRLVYGGHTIGLALAQAGRAIPNLVTVAGWSVCDNTGPVYEGDTVSSTVSIEGVEPLTGAAVLVDLHGVTDAVPSPGGQRVRVLDWHFTAVVA